jgi:hypothetical protein
LKERAIDGRTDENGSSSPAFEQTRQACDYLIEASTARAQGRDKYAEAMVAMATALSADVYTSWFASMHTSSMLCKCRKKKGKKEKKTHCNEDIGRNRIARKLQVIEQEV